MDAVPHLKELAYLLLDSLKPAATVSLLVVPTMAMMLDA
jgi:hypothetical protein